MRLHTMAAAAAAIGAGAPALAAFNGTMQQMSQATLDSYTLLQSLNIADTAFQFTPGGSFTTSGYVNEIAGNVFDQTELTSRVYRVTSQTNLANGLTLNVGDNVFAYTIRLVEDSANTVNSLREFQVGLLDFFGGTVMDGSVVTGYGHVTTSVSTPVANANDFEDLGAFGASLDWQWGPADVDQLDNNEAITLLMFTMPTLIGEGIGNFAAPPGQPTGVDPLATGAPVLIPIVPAPGGALALGALGIACAARRRR